MIRKRGFEVITAYQNEDIALPVRKTARSAGYDFAAAREVVLPAQCVTLIPTGIKAYMPTDEYLGLHMRSSLAVKWRLSLINGQGIIDADYYDNETNEGHIMIAVMNHGEDIITISKGDRIAQGIFYKYLLADQDEGPEAARTGGFGSTGGW